MLEQSLEHHKQELRVAVQELGLAARSWSSPAELVRQNPAAWMVAAFVLGWWLGRDSKVVING